MQNFDEKSANMHMGRLIQMLSHQMKRKNCIVTMIDGDSLTVMQKHILKFILLETLHREIYQKDIEEEFQIRKSTVTGILQLMEKNGLILRESVHNDARLKSLVPTEKAAHLDAQIGESLRRTEQRLTRGLSSAQLTLFLQTAAHMSANLDG